LLAIYTYAHGYDDLYKYLFIYIYIGYKVRAYYLKIWLEDEISFLNECPWETDINYVIKICNMLQIPYEIISLQKEYRLEVIEYTLYESYQGRTPNPDIMCNSRIKFGIFYDYVGR